MVLPCLILSLSLLCSCGMTVRGGSVVVAERDSGDETPRQAARLHIPPGHLPPPGACRIWIPGDPPGHQPPPGECAKLQHRVPVGAWLLRRDANDPEHIEVLVFHKRRPSVVVEIRYFEVASGKFLRASVP